MATPQKNAQVAQVRPSNQNIRAGSIIIVNILAAVFALLVVGIQASLTPDNMWAIVVTALGALIGIIALFIPQSKALNTAEFVVKQNSLSVKDILFVIAIVFFVIGAGLGPVTGTDFIGADFSSGGWSIYLSMLGKILVYALGFFLFIEYSYASNRYSQIKQYAEVQGLEKLELNPVITNFVGVSLVLSIFVVLFSFLVFLAAKGISVAIPSEALKNSIEFNSLYGVTLIAGVIFGLIALVYTFVFGWESFQKITRSFQVEEEEEE